MYERETPWTPSVPCRRLRRGKGSSNMLKVYRLTMNWMRDLEAQAMPKTPKPCTHGNCVWIKSEERYDCEVYA